ncbi:glycosyltransferase family 9 protein [Acidihalobacter ferrooxydans]|uniref:glycosyltransferase family 9 protein n=1 Tax=Acidihalobacter ferrooxydans TaxID=1765967 RepID=UPI0018DE9001|nr:glycosyltransferase family 9 protein [Acidihalobacter ferrooxydans]
MLNGNPDIDALHAYTKAKHRDQGESALAIHWQRLRMVMDLRQRHFDWILLPGGASASALRFARWIGGDQVLIRDDQDKVAGEHEVEQCCHLLTRLGLEYEAPPTRVYPSADEADAAEETLVARLGTRPKHLIGLHISARKPTQRWPAEAFAELARALTGPDTAFILLWAPGAEDNAKHPGDDTKARKILELTAGLPIVPMATTRLEELVAALSLCDTVICGDGGAMHLSAGLNKPIVCLFGQSTAARWHPWGPRHEVLQPQSRNVRDVSVAAVAAAYRRLMP